MTVMGAKPGSGTLPKLAGLPADKRTPGSTAWGGFATFSSTMGPQHPEHDATEDCEEAKTYRHQRRGPNYLRSRHKAARSRMSEMNRHAEKEVRHIHADYKEQTEQA